MVFGYARVSTQDQNLDRQLDELTQSGCERIYQEKITGKNTARPELDNLLNQLRPLDTIIVTELSRLSRSVRDLFSLVDTIHQKGAHLKSLKETWLDTTTPQGKLLFTIFAGVSEFERDMISQRTKEGLASARTRGKKGGRPKLAGSKIQMALTLYESGKHSISFIVNEAGISKASLYRAIRDSCSNSAENKEENLTKTVTVIMHVDIRRNSKFVRGMKAVRDYIEQWALYAYQGESVDESHWRFVVTYTSNKELKETFEEIISDICNEADSRNCFIEDISFQNEKTGDYWDEYNAQWLIE